VYLNSLRSETLEEISATLTSLEQADVVVSSSGANGAAAFKHLIQGMKLDAVIVRREWLDSCAKRHTQVPLKDFIIYKKQVHARSASAF
jgi:indole-3-glycerol phosphate synthase